ncbi:hypothetical protein E1269_23485 [Jiangella asiatica]|uniref:Uncharacterized protein n=1 Tax=Jiangella asiatica TaxID=2530372 RepID=A0A4R5CPJ1_9ACTN|nr:hypothetical protein E1269_23485 [Jiangella asiatica]
MTQPASKDLQCRRTASRAAPRTAGPPRRVRARARRVPAPVAAPVRPARRRRPPCAGASRRSATRFWCASPPRRSGRSVWSPAASCWAACWRRRPSARRCWAWSCCSWRGCSCWPGRGSRRVRGCSGRW